MLATLRRLWWFRTLEWTIINIGRALWWLVGQLAQLVLNAASSFFGWTVRGSVMGVLAKVAAVILFAGLLAVWAGLHDLANGLIILSAAPIMLIGLWMMVRAPFQPAKKKKR